jgi:putative tricarboxylic transport membrane protein
MGRACAPWEEIEMRHYRGIVPGVALASLLAAAVAVPQTASAQWKPTQTISLVSQSSTGTGNDLMMRLFAEIWAKYKMVPVGTKNVNLTGGQGEAARRFVSKDSAGNPHVLFAYTPATLNQAIISNSAYGPDKFTPVAMLDNTPLVVIVGGGSPYKSMKDLVEAARKNPGSVSHAGGPYGGTPSVAGAMIGDIAGIEFPYVPYSGGGEALTALLGSQVQFLINGPSVVSDFVQTGKMRVIAATDKLDSYPNVPTLEEAGYPVPIAQFRIIMAPPGIPKEAVDFYADLLKRTIATPEWKEYARRGEFITAWKDGPESAVYLKQLVDSYRNIDVKMKLLKP